MISKMIVSVAVVTLLSFCSPSASLSFLPRVSRTDDAIIIDFDDAGYGPSYQGKTLYGQITSPRFVPVPSFNPYPLAYRQQQPSDWSYLYEYPSPITVGDLLPAKQTPPAPTPAAPATCGTGPAAMPTARDLISGRVEAGAGADAKKGAWSFLVALKKTDGVFCSGTLLSDSKVLIAAQCLEKLSLSELAGVTALFGSYLTDQSDVQMTRRLSKVVLHEKYNAFNFANDVAILTLDTPVVLSKAVFPACLPPANYDADQYADTTAVILGWGAAPDNKAPATKLQQALVGFQTNQNCKTDATIGKFVSDYTLCTDATTKFTCTTDVGGPVVTLLTPGGWTVIGINSFTPKDCKAGGIKTKVSACRDWIDKYMK